MKQKHFIKFAFILPIIGFSCTEIESNYEPLTFNLESEKIESFDLPENLNGTLKFQSQKSLDHWASKVDKMTNLEFENWQKQIGYESMENFFNYLVEIENKASDSLERIYQSTKILPKRPHSDFTIHSKEVIPHLENLYFFEEGGFFPIASIIDPKVVRLLNSKSQIIVGDEFIEFKENGKFINKKKTQLLNGSNFATITPNSYLDRLDKIQGDYRTITDISYFVNEQNLASGGGTKSASVSGSIQVRNFRKGLFGWNTRKTRSLRIQGNLAYHLYACGISSGPILPPPNFPYSYTNLNITSNGQNTTSLVFNFTSPTNGITRTNIGCTTIPFQWQLNHQLIITGEGNNIGYFNNY